MKRTALIVLLAIALIFTLLMAANAFYFEVTNDSGERLFYDIYWVDHPFVDITQGPVSLITSGLDPGESEKWGDKGEGYEGAIWMIKWRDKKGFEKLLSFQILVPDIVKKVLLNTKAFDAEIDKTKANEKLKKENFRRNDAT